MFKKKKVLFKRKSKCFLNQNPVKGGHFRSCFWVGEGDKTETSPTLV